MNIIKTLITNGGYITKHDIAELAQDFPNLTVVVKWSLSPRSCHMVKDVAQVIESSEHDSGDNYACEVFVSAETLRRLCIALNEPHVL